MSFFWRSRVDDRTIVLQRRENFLVERDGKSAWVYGDILLEGLSGRLILYRHVRGWIAPHENESMSPAEQEAILNAVGQALANNDKQFEWRDPPFDHPSG